MTPKIIKYLRFFGLAPEELDEEHARLYCPLCYHERMSRYACESDSDPHPTLYINTRKNGHPWDCKSCGESGNIYLLSERLYSLGTSIKRSFIPGISPSTLRHVKCLQSTDTGDYLLPIWNLNKTLVGLYKNVFTSDGKQIWYCCPILAHQLLQHPYNEIRYENPSVSVSSNHWRTHLSSSSPVPGVLSYGPDPVESLRPLIVCEGHRDFLSLSQLLFSGELSLLHRLLSATRPCRGTLTPFNSPSVNQLDRGVDLVGVPGANVFKKPWYNLLADRTTFFLYDNDKPGYDGIRRIIREHPTPRKAFYLHWSDLFPSGYDVSDYLLDNT